MSFFSGFRKNHAIALVGATALVLSLGLSACSSDSDSDMIPKDALVGLSITSPSEYIENINNLVDEASGADELEVAAAKAYCDAENTYGQRSKNLSQVVQMTGEHFAQKYTGLLQHEGKRAPDGWWGLLSALNMAAVYNQPSKILNDPFDDERAAWEKSSFCAVAESQVPSSIPVQ